MTLWRWISCSRRLAFVDIKDLNLLDHFIRLAAARIMAGFNASSRGRQSRAAQAGTDSTSKVWPPPSPARCSKTLERCDRALTSILSSTAGCISEIGDVMPRRKDRTARVVRRRIAGPQICHRCSRVEALSHLPASSASSARMHPRPTSGDPCRYGERRRRQSFARLLVCEGGPTSNSAQSAPLSAFSVASIRLGSTLGRICESSEDRATSARGIVVDPNSAAVSFA